MSQVSKLLSLTDYTANYTDLNIAISDMVASGLADAEFTYFDLQVDIGTYSGNLTMNIPNDGRFNIYGKNSVIQVSDVSTISGAYAQDNFVLSNVIIDSSNNYTWDFNIVSGCGSKFNNITFLNSDYGIYSDGGIVELNNINSCGSGIGTFIECDQISINNTSIAQYQCGVYSNDLVIINNSNIYECGTGIYSDNISMNGTLTRGNDIGISISGYLTINRSTFASPSNKSLVIDRDTSSVTIDNSIFYTLAQYCLEGSSTGTLTNCITYSGVWESPNLIAVNCSIIDPKFKDVTNNDYRLIISSFEGSPAIEAGDRLVDSGVTVSLDKSQLLIYDQNYNAITYTDFLNFIYIQNGTVRLTDEGREVNFSEAIDKYKNQNLFTLQLYNAQFSEYNIQTENSFTEFESKYPFEWDYKEFNTTQITDKHKYIIPRSVINIKDLINTHQSFQYSNMLSSINKSAIVVKNKTDYRGVSYDYDLSGQSRSTLWMVEGINQRLLKQDAYTLENIEDWPLLCPGVSTMVTPSGLIYIGPQGDWFKYLIISDPSKEVFAPTEIGKFYWINTEINNSYDFRGILAYKDNLYLTGTKYIANLEDRDSINTGSGVGLIYRYDNNNTFEHYISSEKSDVDIYMLSSGNIHPTDISIYEDGDLLIVDYTNSSGIFKYTLAYDYALVGNSYDKDTMVLLKERYNNVEI